MTKREKFKEFAWFILIWVCAIAAIEYDGIWWLDITGDVTGGMTLVLYSRGPL